MRKMIFQYPVLYVATHILKGQNMKKIVALGSSSEVWKQKNCKAPGRVCSCHLKSLFVPLDKITKVELKYEYVFVFLGHFKICSAMFKMPACVSDHPSRLVLNEQQLLRPLEAVTEIMANDLSQSELRTSSLGPCESR